MTELKNHSPEETMLSVAGMPGDPARLQQAIASIHDSTVLGRLAIEGASTSVRQLAAQAITDPEQLRDLLKHVRGKDKNVYKIIREKCDALLAAEKAAAEIQATIAAVCDSLERHVYVPFDNLFAPAFEHLSQKWTAVATHAAPEMRARAETAMNRCREIIDERARAAAAEAARAAAIANVDTDRQSLLSELRGTLSLLYSHAEDTNRDIARQMERWARRWSELERYKPAKADDRALYLRLCRSIEELAMLIAQHGSLARQIEQLRDAPPTDAYLPQSRTLREMLGASNLLTEVPEIVSDATSALAAWEDSRKEKEAAEANAIRQLGGLIRKASGALHSGNTRLAAGLRRAIEDKMKSIAETPPHLSSQVQQLDQKLNLLQDWRNYAVAPKRIELIEHMEALIGLDESPPVLAEQIKRLQDEWKTISKGNTDNTDAEWQRFHQAAQTAYQPCREYFAAQAKQREANLAKRKALLERLTKFVAAQDWAKADWREVARALRESKQQWRNHQPVERAANKPLQAQFDAITRDLESRLEAESASNIEAKRALIARAKALLGSDDIRKAIDTVKHLQSKWKEIGIVARDEDQKLWAEFREQCDAVFAKREQQQSEFRSSLEEAKRKAIALCEEAEQVLALSGQALIDGAKKVSALSALFDAVGELPKADARALRTRFERALDQCERRVAAQRAQDKAKAWDAVLEAGDKIRRYRLALIHDNGEQQEAAKQAVLAFIDSVQHWPKGALQTVKGELSKATSRDVTANENALRTVCIRAEILTNTPTPESDQAFRRNYQLQQLMKGLGQAKASTQDELDAMAYEWIGIGATSDAVYAELLERFTRCRAKR